MGDLFSGLEKYGLNGLSNLKIYAKEEADKQENKNSPKAIQTISETDCLFDKTYTCPVCDSVFKSKAVRTGKVKLLSVDPDLRPKYQYADSLKYDAVLCPKCGYTALNRYFGHMTMKQGKLIRDNVSGAFNAKVEPLELYTYEEAIIRHKLALVSAIVANGKSSEKAYICLKLAWLYRGKRETLPEETRDREQASKELVEQEDSFLLEAYEGFYTAMQNEYFPICGMDEYTLSYLVAELARRANQHEESLRLVSKLLTTRGVNQRIKEKALIIKEKIKEERAKASASVE